MYIYMVVWGATGVDPAQPLDDLSQPFDWFTAARLAQVNHWIAAEVANAAERPAWKPGNFFGTTFGVAADQ